MKFERLEELHRQSVDGVQVATVNDEGDYETWSSREELLRMERVERCMRREGR